MMTTKVPGQPIGITGSISIVLSAPSSRCTLEVPGSAKVNPCVFHLLQSAEFLEAVVDLDLAYVEVAAGVGPDAVGAGCELAGFVAGLGAAPVAEELAAEGPDADALFELGDVDDFAIGVEVDGIGFEEAGAFLEEVAVGVEELDAVVGAVADPDAVVLVQADAVGECELAGSFAPVAPGEDVLAGG